jgi:MFS family permease
MAIEACMTADTPPDQAGRVSAWYQAGNLGGTGLGGGLGLWLLETLPQPWMAGAIMGALMLACCGALAFVNERPATPHRVGEVGLVAAVRGVARDLVQTLRSTGGMLAALLLVLPIGTGAGSGVLTQAAVAAHWGAGAREVGLLQGTLAGLITAAGCFAGGALCKRVHPRSAYAAIGVALAGIASAMALAPATVTTYIVASTVYNFAVGMAYAAYSATTLDAIGHTAGATKFSTMASLANFPIWWLGLLLGWVADHRGPAAMLHTEAALSVIGVALFALAVVGVRRRVALAA